MPSFQKIATQPVVPRWDSLPLRPISRPVQPVPSVAPATTPPQPIARAAVPTSTPPGSSRPTATLESTPTVSIQVNFPILGVPSGFKKVSRSLAYLLKAAPLIAIRPVRALGAVLAHRTALSATVAVLVVTMAGGGYYFVKKNGAAGADASGSLAAKVAPHVLAKPSFKPVAPKSEPDLGNGKSSATSYDGSHDVYSYQDAFKGEYILISEQKLPTNLGPASQAVSKIASSLTATQAIMTDNGMAYMATDAKASSNTIVYSIDGLLIFVRSPFLHTVTEWQPYLNSLVQS